MEMKVKSMIEIIPVKAKGIASLIKLDKDGITLMTDMLTFSPKKRISPV